MAETAAMQMTTMRAGFIQDVSSRRCVSDSSPDAYR